MSEQFKPRYDNQEANQPPSEKNHEHAKQLKAERETAAASAEQHKPSIENIRRSIEKSAQTKDKLAKPGKTEAHEANIPTYSTANMRKNAVKNTRKRIQKQLPPAERAFSKVVHQPVVEAVSNVAEGTVARPSGLLFGGLCSLISSFAVLYICRHYGYEYNFAIGLVCFAGGFGIGIVAELFYKSARRLIKR